MELRTKEITIINNLVKQDYRDGTKACQVRSSLDGLNGKDVYIFTDPRQDGVMLSIRFDNGEQFDIEMSAFNAETLYELLTPYVTLYRDNQHFEYWD